jgi:hypothetical protein
MLFDTECQLRTPMGRGLAKLRHASGKVRFRADGSTIRLGKCGWNVRGDFCVVWRFADSCVIEELSGKPK